MTREEYQKNFCLSYKRMQMAGLYSFWTEVNGLICTNLIFINHQRGIASSQNQDIDHSRAKKSAGMK